MLQPGHSTELSMTFIPTAAKEYTTAMPLRVMGLYDINIPFRGTFCWGVIAATKCWNWPLRLRRCWLAARPAPECDTCLLLSTAGEGVPLVIEVAKPDQAQRGVCFGAVPSGSCCIRTLPLINKGRAAAHISFAPSAELLQHLGIEVIPAEGVLLKARQTAELTLLYRYVSRMPVQLMDAHDAAAERLC